MATSNTHLSYARTISKLLDSQWSFFGYRIGLDPILGIFPGAGQAFTIIFSFYMIWIGIQLGLPTEKIVRMFVNLLADTLIGSVPVIGDIADFFFRSNLRNLDILENHLKTKSSSGSTKNSDEDYVIIQERR